MTSIERGSRLERIAGWTYFAVLSVWFCLNIAAQLLYQPAEFDKPPEKRVHVDYIRFYAIAPVVISPEREHIYDPAVQLAATNRAVPHNKWQKVFFMEHPPYVFFLAAPLAFLPILQAYWAQMAVSFVIGCLGIFLLARGKPATYQVALIVGLNASWAAWDCYTLGQLGLLLFAIQALFFWALLKNKDGLAGLALSLSSIKPQYLPFLLLPVATTRRWKIIAVAAVAETLLLAVSAWWFGWRTVVTYPAMLGNFYKTMLLQSGALGGFMNEKFLTMRVSLSGPLQLLLPKQAAAGVSSAMFFTSLVVLFLVWLKAGADKSKWSWAIALTVVGSVLFAIHVYLYDCCAATIAIILTLPVLNPVRAWRAEPMSLKLWSVLLICYPIISYALVYWAALAPNYEAASERNIASFVYHLLIFTAGLFYYWTNIAPKAQAVPAPATEV